MRPDLVSIMPEVARALLGDPNSSLSTASELRYGQRGSVAVDLGKGTWYDHEREEGGGVLALVTRETGDSNPTEWLRAQGWDVSAPIKREIVYDYADEHGITLFQVVRLPGHKFYQRQPDGTKSVRGLRQVPYRLPELLAADPAAYVFVVEGEKDVDNMRACGLLATCNAGGAGKWRKAHAEHLTGRRVIILPDNDEAGRNHAATVAASLQGVASDVRVVELPGLPPKGDVSDWLAAGHSADELLALSATAPTPATTSGPKVRNAADLLLREFQPVQWALQGIVPEGITILSGDPKIGKSWLLYQACVAIAAGRPLWGGRDPEIQGDALMLALEDNDRRLKRRLETLLPRFVTIEGRRFAYPSMERLHYATEWPRAQEGVEHLGQWLQDHPGARLVVVDTVSAFRDPEPGKKSAYAHDYAVGEMFKPLARDHKCAIVLVMHNRKQQSEDALQLVSGTQGMTGGVDNVLVLQRKRGGLDAGLYVDGRDIEEPQEIALRFDAGYWAGNGQTVHEAQLSKERRDLLRVVTELGDEAKVKAIAEAMRPKKYTSVKSLLSKMVKAGDLALNDGLYTCTGTVGTVGTAEAA